jgi:hypothetical protein
MSGNLGGTTTNSTDSGHGSAPLSDPFVATTMAGESRPDSINRVVAPEGSAHLHVHRSVRVASSRARSSQPSTMHPAGWEIVDAPPGGKRKAGYAYLQPVAEEAEQSTSSVVPVGNGGGSRDITHPQLGSTLAGSVLPGRKRSASSAAPGSGRRGPAPRTPQRLASAADFSPSHFEEPNSDVQMPSPHQRSHPPSPMAPVSVVRGHPDGPHSSRFGSSSSSPISQNPLLRSVVNTPSPSRRHPQSFRTQDGDAAWAAAEGLLPIDRDFHAPGFVPAQLVGGVTYTVRSPRISPPAVQRTSSGRRLFAEYDALPQQASLCGFQPTAGFGGLSAADLGRFLQQQQAAQGSNQRTAYQPSNPRAASPGLFMHQRKVPQMVCQLDPSHICA